MEAERRQVTVLFTDMVGFTSFSERSGEEAAYTLMRNLSKLMGEAVREQGGFVRGFTGDGIMAVFGAPVAFEDAPLRACRAALYILQRLKAAAPDLEAKHGVRPQLRIGLNTGTAVVGKVEDSADAGVTVLGDTVNFAARLQSLAEPNSVFISEAMHRLVQGFVDASFAGEHTLKGKAEPQKVYRLDAIRQGTTRFRGGCEPGLTTFVGREHELEVLELGSRYRRSRASRDRPCRRSRHGQVAPACTNFASASVRNAPLSSQGAAPGRQQTPFLPFIEVVRGAFRVGAGEGEKDIAQKLEMGLTTLGLHSARNLGLLLHLLGLTVPERRIKGAGRSADRAAHTGAFATIARSAVPTFTGGHGDRGPALDRQRLGGVAQEDHRLRSQAATSAPHDAPARIFAALARPLGCYQISSGATSRWRHSPFGSGAPGGGGFARGAGAASDGEGRGQSALRRRDR